MRTAVRERSNLLGLNRSELESYVATLGAKPFRARQLLKWIYRRGEPDFTRMTDLARDFRAALAAVAEVRVPVFPDRGLQGDWLLRNFQDPAHLVHGDAR